MGCKQPLRNHHLAQVFTDMGDTGNWEICQASGGNGACLEVPVYWWSEVRKQCLRKAVLGR